jgi:hypothetical protein
VTSTRLFGQGGQRVKSYARTEAVDADVVQAAFAPAVAQTTRRVPRCFRASTDSLGSAMKPWIVENPTPSTPA